jgi:hypothetical protein
MHDKANVLQDRISAFVALALGSKTDVLSAVQRMTPVPKCFVAKKKEEKIGFDECFLKRIGKNTPTAEATSMMNTEAMCRPSSYSPVSIPSQRPL